ncbi:hypothetical protein BJI56_10175 [Acinetobacter nosocomialis]|nr:hypothetical protein BJI56_10175 [Acinetobacter nosocomialis]
MTFPQRVSHQDPSKKVSKITASGWYHKSIQEERAEKKMKREYNCKQIFKLELRIRHGYKMPIRLKKS